MLDMTELAEAIRPQLFVLLALTALDFVFGVGLAIYQGRFEWKRLTGYIGSDLLPVMGWVAMVFFAELSEGIITGGAGVIGWSASAVYLTLFGKIAASVAAHFSALGLLSAPLKVVGVEPTGMPPKRDEQPAG